MKKIFKVIKAFKLLNKYYVDETKEKKRLAQLLIAGMDYDFMKWCLHIYKCEDRCYLRIYKLLFTWKKQ